MDNSEGRIVDECCIVSEADGSVSYQRFVRRRKLTTPKKILLLMDALLIFTLAFLAIALSIHLVAQAYPDKDQVNKPLQVTVASVNSTEMPLEDTATKASVNDSILGSKMFGVRGVLEDEKRKSMLKYICIVVLSLAIVFLALMPFFMCFYRSSEEFGGKDWHLLEVKVEKRPENLRAYIN